MPDANDNKSTKREKVNRSFLIGAIILAVFFAAVLASLDPINRNGSNILSSSAISPTVALILAALWGITMPIFAYFWHKKAIDEQESAAYRDGAFYAAYAYIIGAPTWWILARGGMVPDINGGVIFVIFNFIWLGVWFAKKYG